MTTIAAQLPRPTNFSKGLLIITLAFIVASFGFAMGRLWTAKTLGEVTVKPCATCPSCVCKPLLGGPRCGCPQ